jgi:hypothetical protein
MMPQVTEECQSPFFSRHLTAASLDDDETGLYGQSPRSIFSLFNEEMQCRP